MSIENPCRNRRHPHFFGAEDLLSFDIIPPILPPTMALSRPSLLLAVLGLLHSSHAFHVPAPIRKPRPLASLIDANDNWGNWAALIGTATLAQQSKASVVQLLGPPVSAMAMTFGLASTGVLTAGGTEAARQMQTLALQVATPLILLGADLRDARQRSGPLLASFALASLGTLFAACLGWAWVGPQLTRALGKDGLILAAALLAKNIGGGINYVAVCRTLQASPTAVAAGLCVDNIFALLYFPATSVLAKGRSDVEAAAITEEEHSEPISVKSMSVVLFLAASLLWVSERLVGPMGSLPLCTLLTVLLASTWQPIRSFRHCAETLGTFALYLFFATAGAPGLAVASSVRASLIPLGLFLLTLYLGHGALLYSAHKLFPNQSWLQPQRLLVASSAAIGGPATAVALAQAARWESLQVPSLLVGNVGYAIATFVALFFAKACQNLC